jgi:nucleoside-diphosphate-sugar epimerase
MLKKRKMYSYKEILHVLSHNEFDVIYYCAGVSGHNNCQILPYKSFVANVQLPLFLLEAVKETKSRTKIVLFGTCLEYGKPQYLPLDENHPLVPFDLYGIQKAYLSLTAIMYAREHNIDITVLRTTNIYGKDIRQVNYLGHSVINHFIQRALHGETLTIYGDGKQLRDYLYIDDFIDLLVLIGNSKKSKGEVFNVGYGKPISFLQMCQYISDVTKVSLNFVKYPKELQVFERGDVFADIDKVSKLLFWKPKIAQYEGIKECYSRK